MAAMAHRMRYTYACAAVPVDDERSLPSADADAASKTALGTDTLVR